MSAESAQEDDPARPADVLPVRTKLIYGLGDHTINVALSSLLFIFPFFLTNVAGLRPGLAGLVPLFGRAVDAFTDPAMGHLSDRTRFKWGRRRPYFLIGMLPFGLSFAALWADVPATGQGARFAYYAGSYVLFSLSTTILAVPYLALIPELTASYQERTSVNSFRAAWAIVGTLLAVTSFRSLAEAFGGGGEGFAAAGALLGVWLVLPWIPVYAVTFERPHPASDGGVGFLEGVREISRHGSYRTLVGLFLLGRMAIDLTTTMFLFYFTWWLGRPDDFEITMGLFLVSVVFSFPIWTRIAAHTDKRTIFLLGSASWVVSQLFLMLAQPGWPKEAIFVGAAIAGVGYAAADMIPWSMLGEVVDEDELRSGERREGIYFGFFTFLRKLGGAVVVALAFSLLDLVGYDGQSPTQPESAVFAIRWLTAGIPAVFVALAAWVAMGYGIGRARHDAILRQLAERRGEAAPTGRPRGRTSDEADPS